MSDEVEVNVLGTNATLADSDVRSQTIHSFFKTLNSISLALFTSRLQGDGVADGDEDSDVSASDYHLPVAHFSGCLIFVAALLMKSCLVG